MNIGIGEASTVLALLRHLDGSQVLDPTDLVTDVEILYYVASRTLSETLPLDEATLLDTLAEVAQRHADAENYAQDWRDVEDVTLGGARL